MWLWYCRTTLFALAAPYLTLFVGDVSAAVITRGETIYRETCAACHEQASPRIPSRAFLQTMSVQQILRALDSGPMTSIAYPLQRDEREAVARYLGRIAVDPPIPKTAFCERRMKPLTHTNSSGWNGWSPGLDNARFQDLRSSGLNAATVGHLKLKWAFGYRGDIAAVAAPSIVDGKLFVGSASGIIHAIDARSGCLYWTYQADNTVRAAPVLTRIAGKSLLLVGDQAGTFYAIEATRGQLVWKKRIDNHESTRLTGSAAVFSNLVIVPAASWEELRALANQYACCTFRGSVTALNAADGSVVWQTYLVESSTRTNDPQAEVAQFGPSGAVVWSAPTLDPRRGLAYVATGDNYSNPATPTSDAIIALELKTGRIVWSRQMTSGDVFNSACAAHTSNCPAGAGPDFDFGASPVLAATGGRDILLAGQKSGIVWALDPAAKGEILWQTRVGKGGRGGGIQWGLAWDGQHIYAAVADAVRLTAYNPGEPIGNGLLDPSKGGGLSALDPLHGSIVWHAPGQPCVPPRNGCSPAQPGAVSAIPGVVFSGSMDGHLRAFAASDGHILWDIDTVREYHTVNGVAGNGGSLDGAGPVIVDGTVFVNSGYPRSGGMRGNVLLAFSVDAVQPPSHDTPADHREATAIPGAKPAVEQIRILR